MPNTVWIQFAKAPMLGQVKTRIARTLGEASALDAHLLLTRSVHQQIKHYCRTSSDAQWLALNTLGATLSNALAALNFEHIDFENVMEQGSGDLGDKMMRALSAGLKRHDHAVIVGSDFPLLDDAFLALVVSSLEVHDCVLAPTEDGGYGLIACRADAVPDLKGLRWGGDDALSQTIARIKEAGFQYRLLPTRFDVDTESDLARWKQSVWAS